MKIWDTKIGDILDAASKRLSLTQGSGRVKTWWEQALDPTVQAQEKQAIAALNSPEEQERRRHRIAEMDAGEKLCRQENAHVPVDERGFGLVCSRCRRPLRCHHAFSVDNVSRLTLPSGEMTKSCLFIIGCDLPDGHPGWHWHNDSAFSVDYSVFWSEGDEKETEMLGCSAELRMHGRIDWYTHTVRCGLSQGHSELHAFRGVLGKYAYAVLWAGRQIEPSRNILDAVVSSLNEGLIWL